MRRFSILAIALLLGGLLVACGDDDGASSAPPAPESNGQATDSDADATADDDPGDTPPAAPSGTGAAGTVTIGGTTYGMDEALRCEEDSMDVPGIDRELEVQFFSRTDGGMVQLDLYISSIGTLPIHDVSWSGPEGIFGASITQQGGTWTGDGDETYQDAPISIDGNRATGSVVLYDAFTMEESIDIDFDVVIPDDTFACR
jgi:hypothetical protein